MYTLKIKVTQEILDETKSCPRKGGSNCAFALAVRDIFPNAHVSRQYIRVNPERDGMNWPIGSSLSDNNSIEMTPDMSHYTRMFDAHEICEPAEFELEIPDDIIEKNINITEIKELLNNHPTLELLETI